MPDTKLPKTHFPGLFLWSLGPNQPNAPELGSLTPRTQVSLRNTRNPNTIIPTLISLPNKVAHPLNSQLHPQIMHFHNHKAVVAKHHHAHTSHFQKFINTHKMQISILATLTNWVILSSYSPTSKELPLALLDLGKTSTALLFLTPSSIPKSKMPKTPKTQ